MKLIQEPVDKNDPEMGIYISITGLPEEIFLKIIFFRIDFLFQNK